MGGLPSPRCIGHRFELPVLLSAAQASLTDEDTALCTATWSFMRTFGFIWGAIIATAVFNNQLDRLAPRINDTAIGSQLTGGRAYESATKVFINPIVNSVTVAQVQSVYVDSLNVVWYVSLASAGLEFLFVFLEKEVPLRKRLDTKFAVEVRKKTETEA